jgi:acyl-CoA hydrolase
LRRKSTRKKLITADEAAKLVKSGDWVDIRVRYNCARDFDEALARRVDELSDVKIRCDIGAYSTLRRG